MSIRGKIEAVQRLIKWIPIIWNNYDFDAQYLLKLEVEKLKSMSKAFRDGSAMSSLDNSKQMDELIEIGEWLLDSDNSNWRDDEALAEYKKKLKYFYNTIAERFVYWWD